MILELDTHGGAPIYRQIMEQIRRHVLTDQLPAGHRMESVKSLAARLKVNPMTVSKAYGFLVEEGVLERQRGVGLFVSAMRADTRRRKQDRLLGSVLHQAAVLAVQLQIPEDEALRQLSAHYQRLQAQSKTDQSS
ncbi:MAG: GntR family transcriptional regulator [Planctomycetes bacterium]|nr:GntR family transcriptional regulator [Planctomycetota bacterium]